MILHKNRIVNNLKDCVCYTKIELNAIRNRTWRLYKYRIQYYKIIEWKGVNKLNYGENGYLDFSKLWKLLEKKNLKQQYLINNGIHRNTIYKLKNNENVTSEVICNICKLLKCQPKDIMEYVPNIES